MRNYITELKEALIFATMCSLNDLNEMAILFSGGLDSSLLAYLVKDNSKNTSITLYTIGTKESHDIRGSDAAAKLLGLKLKKILINSKDIASAIPILSRIIDSENPVKISYELPLYLALARIDEESVLSGQGADELFGGYARYLKMNKDELEKVLKKDIKTLINEEIMMDYRVADHFKKNLQIPYLHNEVVKTAQSIPIKYKVYDGERKIILKETALDLGLNPQLSNKKKKAIQYSSGIIKDLRKMAKQQKKGVNELIDGIL